MSRFGWAFVNDVIIGTGSAGTGSAVDGPAGAVVVKDGGIISGATKFNFNNSTGFGQLTGSLAISSNLTVNGNLSSGPITATTITATTNLSASSLTGTLRSNTGNKFGSAAGDVHQFTGSIYAAAISGTTVQFTTISGSTITGSTAYLNNIINSTLSNTTIITNTITSSVLLVTGATNTIIGGVSIATSASVTTSPALNSIGGTFDVSTVTGLFVKPDGQKVYVIDDVDNTIIEYSLTTAWNLSTLVAGRTVIAAPSSNSNGLWFKPNGTKIFAIDSTTLKIYSADLSIPWDLSTASAWSESSALTGTSFSSLSFSQDGLYFYTNNNNGTDTTIYRFSLTTAWDISSVSTTPQTATITGIPFVEVCIGGNGNTIFGISDDDLFYQYKMPNKNDLSNLTQISSLNVVATIPNAASLFVSPNTSKVAISYVNSVPYIKSFNITSSQIDLTGDVNINANLEIAENIYVYGDATFEDLSGSNAQFRILSASSVDINGGTIDGTTIATSDITVGSGKTLNVSAGTLTLAAAQIGADKIAGATFGAGTYSFSGRTISNLGTVTTADINGGTIDGTTIGVTSATTGKFTELTASTNLSASQIFLGTSGMTASSNIIPLTNNTYDLGSNNNRWRDIYVSNSINVPNISATSISGTSITGSIISGSTITGSNITSSNFVGNGANITNITASNIPNFTNDVRAKISAGTGIIINSGVISASNIPNASLTNSSIMIGTTGISLGATGSIIQGINTLTGSNITGSDAKFTSITGSITGSDAKFTSITGSITGSDAKFTSLTASIATINTITSSIGLSGSQGQFSQLTASSADINGGTIDGTIIGNTSAVEGKFTVISGSTAVSSSQGRFAQVTASAVEINGGTINNTSIGATTQSTGKFTTLSASSTLNVGGNVTCYGGTLYGNAASITGDIYGAGNIYSLTGDLTTTNGDIKTTNGTFIKGTLTSTTRGFGIKQELDSDTYGITLEAASTANNWDIYINSGTDLRFLYNNNIAYGGYLDSAVDVGAIDFTGQHRNLANVNYPINANEHIGLIVVSCGQYKNSNMSEKPTINESLPFIKLSDSRNQKSVWGVVSDSEDPNDLSREYGIGIFVTVIPKQNQDDNRIIINSIGEGGIWVCNINGNLENGDYITTCEVPGYGMKQDDDLLHNYTVAKITQDCTFELNNPNYDCVELQFSGSTYRKAFVGCTYHCG